MTKNWEDSNIGKAAAELDQVLDKIFEQADRVMSDIRPDPVKARVVRESELELPEAEILPDDEAAPGSSVSINSEELIDEVYVLDESAGKAPYILEGEVIPEGEETLFSKPATSLNKNIRPLKPEAAGEDSFLSSTPDISIRDSISEDDDLPILDILEEEDDDDFSSLPGSGPTEKITGSANGANSRRADIGSWAASTVADLSPRELSRLIEAAVTRGVMAALKK